MGNKKARREIESERVETRGERQTERKREGEKERKREGEKERG